MVMQTMRLLGQDRAGSQHQTLMLVLPNLQTNLDVLEQLRDMIPWTNCSDGKVPGKGETITQVRCHRRVQYLH